MNLLQKTRRQCCFLRGKFSGVLLVSFFLKTVACAASSPGLPDGWSDGYVYANGVRIHYCHAVPAPGKPVMVMVHGVTDNALCWTTLAWKLQADYDIYMLDTRGHGLSDPFAAGDDRDTLIQDVVAFVKTMEFEKPILVGHSMGAATVMQVGAEAPDLAQAVIMLDPFLAHRAPAGAPPAAAPSRRRPEADSETSHSESRENPAPAPARNLSVNMMGSPQTLVAQNNYSFDALVAKCRHDNPKWDLVDCRYWALSKKQYHGAYSDSAWLVMSGTMQVGDSLERIPVPSLVLKADGPESTRQANEAAVQGLDRVKLVHVDDAAHNLHHDQLERTCHEIAEFLATVLRP